MKNKKAINDDDRISQLPVDLKLHILTFLTTIEAAATSLLSRSWKNLWLILPCFRFDQNFFDMIIQNHPKITDEQLLNTVDEICTRRSKFGQDHNYNVMFEELIFHYPRSSAKNNELLLYYKIIRRAVKEIRVKKLDEGAIDLAVHISFENVPASSLSRKSSKTKSADMSHLTIRGMRIISCSEASYVLLKVLSLNSIKIKQSVLDSFISNFVVLESLELIHCTGKFDTLNASCLKQLVSICIKVPKDSSSAFKKIVINAPNLEHFIFHDESPQGKSNCIIIDDLSLSEGLRSLDIKNAKIADEWLSQLIAQLTKLTRLILHDCYGLRAVRISSNSLRLIDLTSHEQLEEIRITDSPNLQELMYLSTHSTIPSFVVKDASSLKRVSASFSWEDPNVVDELEFEKLTNFFEQFQSTDSLEVHF